MRTQLKIIRPFLRQTFPENLLPHKKLSKKDKRFVVEKQNLIRKKKRNIQKVYTTLSKELVQLGQVSSASSRGAMHSNNRIYNKKQKLKKKIRFLFSHSQIKKQLLNIDNSSRRDSPFSIKLKERKKLSIFYGGIDKKFFQKVYLQAEKKGGNIAENILFQLENRLDTVLYRIGFAKTITSARQYISHSLVLVNGNPLTIATYQLQPGDFISLDINLKKKVKDEIQKKIKFVKTYSIYSMYNDFSSARHGLTLLTNPKTKKLTKARNLVSGLQATQLKRSQQFLSLLPDSIFLQYIGHNIFKSSQALEYIAGSTTQAKQAKSDLYAKPFSLSAIFHKCQMLKKRVKKLTKRLLRKKRRLKRIFQHLTFKCRVGRRKSGRLKWRLQRWEQKRIPRSRLKKIKQNLWKSFLIRLTIKRLTYIPNNFKKFSLRLNSLADQKLLLEKTRQECLELMVQKLLSRPLVTKRGKQIRKLKPFHFDICFQKIEATLLYPTQKVVYPLVLDLELISRLGRST